MKKKKKIISISILVVLFIPLILSFDAYWQDRNAVQGFMRKHGIDKKEFIKEAPLYTKVISVRDILISELSMDLTKMGKRPIWGYRISRILGSKAAQCGETTRILINILHKINVPARRVTLFGQGTMHAIVEALLGKKWILIDSNHGPEGFREYSTLRPASIKDHFRTAAAPPHLMYADKAMQDFGFHTYGYSFNFNKVTYRCFGVLVFIQKPFPSFIFYLMENPPLIFGLAILSIIAIWGIVLLINIKKKKKQTQ